MKKGVKAESRKGLWLTFVVIGLLAVLAVLPFQFNSKTVEANNNEETGLVPNQTRSHQPGLENYDIREQKSEEIAQALLDFRSKAGKTESAVKFERDKMLEAEDALRQRVPTLKVEYNTDLRIPEVIGPDVLKGRNFLTEAAGGRNSEKLRNFLRQNNELIGMTDEQLNQLKVTADYTNPNGDLSFAHLEQFINGVPVFRGEAKAGFTRDGRMIRVINNLAPGLDYSNLSEKFFDPADAVRAAFRQVGREMKEEDTTRNAAESTDLKVKFGQGDWATTAERMYFPIEPGVARASWRVLIWEPVAAYYVIVDAETGTMLWRKNITNDQTQSSTYNVWANSNAMIPVADSPNPLTPGPISPTLGTQGARIARTSITRIGNEAPYTFNNNGWITDGTNETDGNAVEAGLDRDATNGVDVTNGKATGTPNRVFNFPSNPGDPSVTPTGGEAPIPTGEVTSPCASIVQPRGFNDFQKAAVTQLFYVNNWYHDEMYRLGFTEQARNFQALNFGRGGVEGDRVSAEGQDCSGTNNANFATPADGTRGRMQMYIWTGPTPDFDGTIDADVIIHEHTHGLSNRLHGGSGGLTNNMSGGMGEGWSDFYAHSLLSEPTDPINGIYTTGGYATYLIAAGFTGNYYYGIRRFPKAVIAFTGPNSRPHNPLTFRHLNSNCNTEIGTSTTIGTISAFPRGPIGVAQCDQVHNAGEVWSSALWEVRAKFIARLGAAAGNRKALQLVTDGMKLAPLNPTFLQERNAILAAAQASTLSAPDAAADVADVWAGFALRGMGFSATITTASPAVVTEAFDLPNVVIAPTGFTVTDPAPGGDNDGFPEPGETITLTVPITNTTGVTVNNVTANVTGGSTATYGNIDNAATVTRTMTYLVPATAACGSLHTVTININSSVGMRSETREFRLGAPVGGPPTTAQNTAAITINDNAPAAPYPSNITVAGVPAGNFKVKITLTGLTHTFPGDIDVLLVNPNGQALVVMSDVGGADDVNAINVTIDDAATGQMPAAALTTGTYQPTNVGTADPFAAPAPTTRLDAAPAGTATMASVFGAGPYNGQWSLYIVDDAGIDVGSVAGGWSITFESNNFNCSFASSVKSRADFDGDGRTDLSVFRAGVWYVQQSTAGFAARQWGTTGDTVVSGKWDADTKEDFAIFRPVAADGNPDWWVTPSTGTPYAFAWGTTGDIPVEGDYDADGRVDAAVFRPSNNTWYILRSAGGTTTTVFGQTGDVPTPIDFDGDGRLDLAVFRAGSWVIQPSSGGAQQTIAWGAAGNLPVAADYNNDNIDDLAVYETGTGIWRIRLSGAAGGTRVFAWGQTGDVPVSGDYNGDGADEIAIYRNGTWYINSGTGGLTVAQFGLATDTPVPRSYAP